MAFASSLHVSLTFRCSFSLSSSSSHNEPRFLGHRGRPNLDLLRHSSSSSSSHNEPFFLGHHGEPNVVLLRHSSSPSSSVLACSRRRSKPNSAITSNSMKKKKKKKQNLPQYNVGEDDDLDEDAFEALFRQLEEDLKNDDPSAIDGDGEITEEDLALLERELEEALGLMNY